VPDVLPLGTVLDHPCPECGGQMVLRNSRYGLFYGCTGYPECRAAHGAHADGRPLGTPADAATKKLRIEAHAVFDRLWKGGSMSRSAAYRWLREAMELSEAEAHIGRFTSEQCLALMAKVDEHVSHG